MVGMLRVISDSDNDGSMEATIEAQVASNILTPVTWQQIRDDVAKDKIMMMVTDQISEGFAPDKKLPPSNPR